MGDRARWPVSLKLTPEQAEALARTRELSDLLDRISERLFPKLPPAGADPAANRAHVEFSWNALSIAAVPKVVANKMALGRFRPYWLERPLFTSGALDYWRSLCAEREGALIDEALDLDVKIRSLVGSGPTS
jgi:hypothetical protein